MATYGSGQMLGSGINPESFKQDYSGFSRAAEIQAQGLSNLGGSIAGAIKDYGEMKKSQQEDERAVQKSKSVAKAIGDLIPDLKPTLLNSLTILDNKELPLSQRKAEAEAISDILNLGIGEIRNKQKVEMEKSRNAPPPPAPLTFEDKLFKTNQGDVLVKQGSDGQIYDPKTKYPIFDLPAYGRGEAPEVFSNQSSSGTASQIDAGLNVGSGTSADGGPGVLPSKQNTDPALANAIAEANGMVGIPSDVPEGLSPLTSGNAARQVQRAINIDGPPMAAAQAQPSQTLVPRYISDKPVPKQTGTIMTQEQVDQLVTKGAKLEAIPMADGKFIVSSMTIGGATPSVTEEIAVARYNDEKQKSEMEKAQGIAASARTLKLIDKYINKEDNTATPALEDAVGFGESVGSFIGNIPYSPFGNSPESIANQKELQLDFLEKSILEASKALKPVSVDEMKFLQSNRPKITDKVEVWTQYLNKIKDTLSNPENYVQGSATESNDPVQEASRKLRGMLPQK